MSKNIDAYMHLSEGEFFIFASSDTVVFTEYLPKAQVDVGHSFHSF